MEQQHEGGALRRSSLSAEEAKPIAITCPLCGRNLGAIVITDPDLLVKGVPALQLSLECSSGLKHSELEIVTVDLAKKRAAEEAKADVKESEVVN